MRRHRSIRSWLALTAAVATASGFALISPVGAGATSTHTITLAAGDPIDAVEEGSSTGENVVAKFTDSTTVCMVVLERPQQAATEDFTASIEWGDGKTTSGSIGCDESDVTGQRFVVTGTHTFDDSMTPATSAFPIKVKVTHTDGTTTGFKQTDSVIVSDAPISTLGPAVVSPKGPIKEGQSVTVTGLFVDHNHSTASDAAGLTASVKWPDGSTSTGTVTEVVDNAGALLIEACCRVFKATVTGTPDAGVMEEEPFIKLSDDGGKSAITNFSLKVDDAALTAGTKKSLSGAPNAQMSGAVASFTDAAGAQAAVADFKASIDWGDGTAKSSGTVTKIGSGAFAVSGSHTFTTAGTRTLTVTVIDEEGATLTTTATATVTAPVVLPATGQPHGSGTSGWPLLPAALILLGLVGVSAGLIRTRFARR